LILNVLKIKQWAIVTIRLQSYVMYKFSHMTLTMLRNFVLGMLGMPTSQVFSCILTSHQAYGKGGPHAGTFREPDLSRIN